MKDKNKTKAQLIDELVALRQEIAGPEKLDAEHGGISVSIPRE